MTVIRNNDLKDITRKFEMLHPGVSCAIALDNRQRVLDIYLAKDKYVMDDLPNAFKRTVLYSEIWLSSDPLMAIENWLNQAYFEFTIQDPTCVPDLTEIAQDFNRKHPDVYVRFHVVTEFDYIRLRVETKDGQRVHRIISRDELQAAEEPVAVITTILESAYNELMRKNQEEKNMPTKECTGPAGNETMMRMAKCAVASWYNTHGGPRKIKPEDVYVVWFCKTLQNWKALCSTDIHDGMYYEVTYDGDKDAAYVDAYKKWDNQEFLGEDLRKDILMSYISIRHKEER